MQGAGQAGSNATPGGAPGLAAHPDAQDDEVVRVPAGVYEQGDEACASAAVLSQPSKTKQGLEPSARGRARTDERQDGEGQLEGEAAHDKALHGRVEHDH